MPNNQSTAIVQRLWNYCTVLRDDGLSYGDYVEQLTYLLFLKMADERKMIGQDSPIPEELSWASLVRLDGDELESHYRHVLNELGIGKGLIPTIFRKAQNRVQDPAKLKRLVTLIDGENWSRLCVMNLYLHGIGHNSDRSPIHVDDSLASKPSDTYDMVLTNPPFGKKSSVTYITEDGEVKRESQTVVRDDFWTSTSNKQLNFVQHVHKLLKQHGRAAVVVPDNVLFEGGAGETVRRKLLQESELNTILRLPTGIFYAQGVKANVLFFDRKPGREKAWTERVWYYGYRTNVHHTLKQNPISRPVLDEFVACFNPANRHERWPTWSEETPNGRWRSYGYDELMARDKVKLDIFWLRDESPEETENLPKPEVIAEEIVEDLEAALEQFRLIAEDLGDSTA
jgi:type I restriction enzyme M protein